MGGQLLPLPDQTPPTQRAGLVSRRGAGLGGGRTRRVKDLVQALGGEGISKSQVSRICSELDAVVDSFLGRPLDGGPIPLPWPDALIQTVREDGRIVNVSVAGPPGSIAKGLLANVGRGYPGQQLPRGPLEAGLAEQPAGAP